MRFRWWFRWVDVERDEKEGGNLEVGLENPKA